jgi:hypothetical protein
VLGQGDAGPVTLFDREDPIDPMEVEVADPLLLRPDADGGLRLTVRVGDLARPDAKGPRPAGKAAGRPPDLIWKIESLGLEVTGRTAGGR